MPPTFNRWNEFETFFDISKRAGLYNTVKDIHWDARPSPNLGTLEIRIMDAQSTVSDAVCRAAFLQALVYYLRDKDTSEGAARYYEYEYWLEKDNLYQASHLGLSAAQTGWHGDYTAGHSNRGLLQIFEEVLNDVVSFIQSSEKYKNSVDLNYLYRLRNQIYEPYGYQLQRNLYAERLSLKAVTKSMVERLSQELAV
jgi:carboxylate-amine ligase